MERNDDVVDRPEYEAPALAVIGKIEEMTQVIPIECSICPIDQATGG